MDVRWKSIKLQKKLGKRFELFIFLLMFEFTVPSSYEYIYPVPAPQLPYPMPFYPITPKPTKVTEISAKGVDGVLLLSSITTPRGH